VIGTVIVFFCFPKKAEEDELLEHYQESDRGPGAA
jgi:hypothetical protein